MKKLPMILLVSHFSFAYVYSQITATPGAVVDINKELIVFHGAENRNGTVRFVINEYNWNLHWLYKLNDTLFLDSSTHVITGFNAEKEEITLTEISYIQQENDRNIAGLSANSSALFDNCIVTIDSIDGYSAELTVYQVDTEKVFVDYDDTVIVEGTNVVYIHLFDQHIAEPSCRHIILNDSIILIRYMAFYYHPACGRAYLNSRGYIRGNKIQLNFDVADDEYIQYLSYVGNIDSTIVTLDEGSSEDIGNIHLSLEWIHYSEHYRSYSAGIRLNDRSIVLTIPHKRPIRSSAPITEKKQKIHDLLGRVQGNIRNSGVTINKNEAGILIR